MGFSDKPGDAPRRPVGRPRKVVAAPAPEIVQEQWPRDENGNPIEVWKGRKSATFFRRMFGELNDRNRRAIAEDDPTFNYKQAFDGLCIEARMNGVNPESLGEERTELDAALLILQNLGSLDGSKFIDLADEQLDVLERAMDRVDKVMISHVRLQREKSGLPITDIPIPSETPTGKAWRGRIKRLRLLRERARKPNAKQPGYQSKDVILGRKAAHCLRYAVYVMRSNTAEQQKAGSAASVLQFVQHHIEIAWELYRSHHSLVWKDGEAKKQDSECKGAICVLPPGHGKTTIAFAFFGLQLSLNPYAKLMIGHANADKAKENLVYLSTLFDPEAETGRRNATLFNIPKAVVANTGKLRLANDSPSKGATMSAYGMKARVSGSDAEFIWFDDPVDKPDRDQPGERRRTYEAINSVWLPRLRENGRSFHVTTATIWHEEDATSLRIRNARSGDENVNVLVRSCGGPESTPPFHHLWDVYPPKILKSFYSRDPLLYACQYMSDPRPEQMQIVRKLRYYDPMSEEHATFLRSSQRHITLDPSATTRADSDKAGIVVAAVGEIETESSDGAIKEYRMRIIDAQQIMATQTELVEHVGKYAQVRKVDHVHYESVGGFAALGEMFETRFGISTIPHLTGNKSKEVRFRQVAVLIEHTSYFSPEAGAMVSSAVVEFPGRRTESGRVEPDPAYSWLYEQFLKFGMVKDDHCVDAATHLIGYLVRNSILTASGGIVSNKVRDAIERGIDPAMKKELESLVFKINEYRDPNLEDAEYWARQGDHAWNTGYSSAFSA